MSISGRSSLPPFQWVFDENAAAVTRFLARQMPTADAQDCFQETMLAALRAYPKLSDASNLRGWLLTIARRKVIDAHRAAARRPVPVADPAATSTVAAGDVHSDDELWDSVRGLPVAQRRAVALRFAGDRSYKDIARTLSISEDAARQRVHQGVKALRRELQ